MDKDEAIERLRVVICDLENAKDADVLEWDKHAWNAVIDYVDSVKEYLHGL